MQSLLDTGNLSKGILHMYEKENDRKLWDLYLHSFSNESFEDWKEKVTRKKAPKELSQDEIKIQVSKSNDILKTFRL